MDSFLSKMQQIPIIALVLVPQRHHLQKLNSDFFGD